MPFGPSYGVITLKGVTDASGDAVVNSERSDIVGEIVAVMVDGIAITDSGNLTLASTYIGAAGSTVVGENIINHADIGNAAINNLYPADYLQDNAGVDLLAATGVKVAGYFAMLGGGLRATVSAGGNAKAFQIRVLVKV